MLATLGLLNILIGLNVLDLATTVTALRAFRRREPELWYRHEKNPLGRVVLVRGGGIAGVFWLKLWALTVVLAAVSHIPRDMLFVSDLILVVVDSIYCCVVVNNLLVIRRLRLLPPRVIPPSVNVG